MSSSRQTRGSNSALLYGFLVLGCILACQVSSADEQTTFISNIEPRRNSSGEIIDAHDGNYQQWGGPGTPFYYYAMGYGLCKQDQWYCTGGCGYGYSWIGIWKSRRLSYNGTWEMVRSEARAPGWPDAIYFRVHVVFRAHSEMYIMWVNIDGSSECPTPGCDPKKQGCTCYFVGTSESPDGPFKYVGATATRYVAPGDFDILVEGDDAYIIYTATLQDHAMSVERLSEDWLRTMSPSPPTPPPAPPPVCSINCRLVAIPNNAYYSGSYNESQTHDVKSIPACQAACLADAACVQITWASAQLDKCVMYQQITASLNPGAQAWAKCNSSGTIASACAPFTPPPAPGPAPAPAPAPRGAILAWQSDPSPTNISSGFFGDHDSEAPAIFRRGDTYYALFGQCCCFCSQGSGITVHTASHPLGPWLAHGNIGCANATAPDGTCDDPTAPPPCDPHGIEPAPAACRSTVTHAQQNTVIRVHTVGGDQFLWNGDRWQSAADGKKGHDLQYTAPLVWYRDSATGLDLPKHLAWVGSFALEIT